MKVHNNIANIPSRLAESAPTLIRHHLPKLDSMFKKINNSMLRGNERKMSETMIHAQILISARITCGQLYDSHLFKPSNKYNEVFANVATAQNTSITNSDILAPCLQYNQEHRKIVTPCKMQPTPDAGNTLKLPLAASGDTEFENATTGYRK